MVLRVPQKEFEKPNMKFPPAWKIKREWRYFRNKIASPVRAFVEPFRLRNWDGRRKRKIKSWPGRQDIRKDVAIFVIYQRRCVPDSVLMTMQTLVDGGFSVLVVSNSRFSRRDLEKLKSLAWTILQRPNLGYDFGAYRDGLWFLQSQGIGTNSLLFLNDTVFFPVRSGDKALEVLMNRPEDYVGLTDGIFHEDARAFTDDWRETLHVTSYFFLVRGAALKSKAFRDYWDRYQMSSQKWETVRRGEVGFFEAMHKAGFAHWVLLKKEDILENLKSLDTAELLTLARNVQTVQADVRSDWRQFLDGLSTGAPNRSEILQHLSRVIQVTNTTDIIPYDGIRLLNFPMLKKTAIRRHQSRESVLNQIEGDDLQIHPQILAELRVLD